jgi:acyl carrier protein
MEKNRASDILIELLSDASGRSVDEITVLDRLDDFQLDSLEFVDFMQEVSSKIKPVPQELWATFDTVGDLIRAIE